MAFPENLLNTGNQLVSSVGSDIIAGASDIVLPDNISFSDQEYFKYPKDLLDPTKHATFLIIAPYDAELTNKGNEDTKLIINELPPIFIKMPTESETSFQHNYSEESLLYNAREVAQGGGRSGGLQSNDVAQILGGGLLRNTLQLGQNLPGGSSIRSAVHGGARAATELLYDSPKLRDFVFSWKFFPDDAKDEESFIDIYRYLMFLSAPTYSLATQRYPAIFDLQFATIDTGTGDSRSSLSSTALNSVMSFTRCSIESITPSWSPSGGSLSPSGLPQEIDLTIQFKEVMPLDRETIKNKEIGRISGNSTLNSVMSSILSDAPRLQNTGIRSLLGGA